MEFVPAGDEAALAAAMGPDVAALIVEPIQGEAGVRELPPGYLEAARELTEAAGAPTGDTAALDGAYGLAAVALDWLHDAELRRAVRADFEASGGAIDVAGFWEE